MRVLPSRTCPGFAVWLFQDILGKILVVSLGPFWKPSNSGILNGPLARPAWEGWRLNCSPCRSSSTITSPRARYIDQAHIFQCQANLLGVGEHMQEAKKHLLSDPHTCMASLLRVPSNKQVKYTRFRLMSPSLFSAFSSSSSSSRFSRDFNLTPFPPPTRQSSRRNLERIQSRCLSISTTTFWPSAPSSRPSMPGTLVS